MWPIVPSDVKFGQQDLTGISIMSKALFFEILNNSLDKTLLDEFEEWSAIR